MTESTQKPQHACQEEFNCSYKVSSYCTYREIIKAIFSDTQNEDRWGPWEPPGAGMVFRNDIGKRFVDFVRHAPEARLIGAKGKKSFLRCEDSLLARMACRLGYSSSYQPSLKLYHYIPAPRLKVHNLARLLYGLGRSFVILERVLGKPVDASHVNAYTIYSLLLRRLIGRARYERRPGLVRWSWDIGYFLELLNQNRHTHGS